MARCSHLRDSLIHDADKANELLESIRNCDVVRAVKLLAGGTSPDVQDANGDWAIHLAVDTCFHDHAEERGATLVKLLIVFYASLHVTDKHGLTPLQRAAKIGSKAEKCKEAIQRILDLLDKQRKDGPRPWGFKDPPRKDDKDIYMLTLDGGAIKGLVFIQVLLAMEERKNYLYPGSKPFLSYFNWIGGNSTGGLSALAFTSSAVGLKEGRRLYIDLKDEILSGPMPFSNETVSAVFKKVYGAMKLREIKDVNVAVMTTIATTVPPKLRILSNYEADPEDDLEVWEAARATSALVPAFHPYKTFLDGGFIANNPTCDTIVDMKKTFAEAKLKGVLSLGCGRIKPKDTDEPDFQPLPGWLDTLLKKLSATADMAALAASNIHGSQLLVELMVNQISQPCDEVVDRGRALAEALGAVFYRVNPAIDDISSLETKDDKLIDMMYQAMDGILGNDKLDAIIDTFVGNDH